VDSEKRRRAGIKVAYEELVSLLPPIAVPEEATGTKRKRATEPSELDVLSQANETLRLLLEERQNLLLQLSATQKRSAR
jgi:hypothetical protein